MKCEPLLEPFLVQYSEEIDSASNQVRLYETKFTEVDNETTDDD